MRIRRPLYKLLFFTYFLFVILPIIYTFGFAFIEKSSYTNFSIAFTYTNLFLLGKSVLIAFIIASLSCFLGIILGFILYKIKIPFQNIVKLIILIPLFISPYILAVAWKDFFFLINESIRLSNSLFAVILVLTSIYTPLSTIIIGSALSNIHASIEESALLFSNYPRMIFRILLPLIKPAIFTSFAFIFIFSISNFSIPAYFGIKVLTTEIFIQFSAFYHHSLAIIQSLFLVLICLLLLFAENKYLAEASFLSVGSKGQKIKSYNFRTLKYFGLLFLLFWIITTVILPLSTLSIQAFQGGTNHFFHAIELLTPSFIPSISLALIGAFGILFIGFIIAQYPHKSALFNKLLLFVFAIPSTIFGISLIKFYNQTFLDFIYSSTAIILIAYIGKFSFISTKVIENGMRQIPKSLQEVAVIHGITTLKRIRYINIPLLLPSLSVSFFIAFIFSIGELGTSIMLYPPGTELMPIKVFTIMANAPQSLTSAMALIVFSITLMLMLILFSVFKFLFPRSN